MQDYWDALERLKAGCPSRVPLGSSINKDTVALEAGRKRGSIKKSRSSFGKLIAAIDTANREVDVQASQPRDLLRKVRAEKQNYKELYHQALNRELMLLDRLARLEKELARFSNVLPIRE
ncbi:hypothetical protein [Vibrio cholerae]|uniref:hypothetical protein n=1 Tax=Vibrio cholerae TaxID=666 RepID=UPI0006E67FDC|nr:hypothetical protein [Vibrio cholerae]KQA53409.1 hypothetical protein XV78_09945 [Vibrio cholerae]KQA66161.1 hypothetical protein XV81_02080 [Vibrio cholerae]KQA94369.1 hypothetical protein XV90_12700 [Vibrio cholerae]MBW5443930.1 hypothetical protein [Vibrio cholerae]QKV04660.1 hypothetical protein HPY12_12560 [Vibrio cholerae]